MDCFSDVEYDVSWNFYSQHRANEIWETDCVVLDLYLVYGHKKTKADIV